MGSNPFKKIIQAVKKVVPKEIVAAVAPTPVVVPAPEPAPPPPPAPAPVAPTPAPAPAPAPVAPKPTPVAKPAPVTTPDPVVSDPVPVTAEPMETQETAQDLQRLKTKKKGRKPLIATSAQGLGGEAPTYTPTLLG